jgi:hypothetical protein
MMGPVIESYAHLLRIELIMRLRGLRALHDLIRRSHPGQSFISLRWSSAELCHAVDLACALYLKRVLCLQRSAATTLLLRRHGFKAELVIGAQVLPFRSHAWVEIENVVVNDKPYVPDIYQVLSRC